MKDKEENQFRKSNNFLLGIIIIIVLLTLLSIFIIHNSTVSIKENTSSINLSNQESTIVRCIDSDNGLDFQNKGTISFENKELQITKSDVCTKNSIEEFFCIDSDNDSILDSYDSVIPNTNPCEYGCGDGRCLKESESKIDEQKKSCEFTCEYSVSNLNSKNEYDVVSCFGDNCFYRLIGCKDHSLTDYESKSCDQGCYDGECLSGNWKYSQTGCIDSDKYNLTNKGYTQRIREDYARFPEFDYCILNPLFAGSSIIPDIEKKVSSCSGEKCYLVEQICLDEMPIQKGVYCEYGCNDGACLES